MIKFADLIPEFKKMEGKESVEALFLFATEGILVTNDRGTIVRINPSAEKLFRYDSGELVGKPIETLVPMRSANKHADYRHEYNEHPHARSMGAGLELFGRR